MSFVKAKKAVTFEICRTSWMAELHGWFSSLDARANIVIGGKATKSSDNSARAMGETKMGEFKIRKTCYGAVKFLGLAK